VGSLEIRNKSPKGAKDKLFTRIAPRTLSRLGTPETPPPPLRDAESGYVD